MMAKSGTLKPSVRVAARQVNPVVAAGRKHLGGARPHDVWDDVKREYVSAEELEARTAMRKAAHPELFDPEHSARNESAENELVWIQLDKIIESPDNPRTEFDETELNNLVEDIRRAGGLLQPLLVLPQFGGTHELVAGARRLRACRILSMHAAPCLVRDLDPKDAALARLSENAQRADINPLEKARAIDKAIKQHGATQAEIGKSLGIEQSTVSNHLRLLKLPEAWHKLIADGTLTEAHAKIVLPYVDRALIMKELLKAAKDPGSVKDWQDEVGTLVYRHTRTMDKSRYEYDGGRKFEATPDELQRLGVISITYYGDKLSRATNVTLWDELQKAAKAQAADRERKREAKGKANSSGRSKEDEKKLREQQAKTRAKRMYRYKLHWLQQRIAAKLPEIELRIVLGLLIYFSGPRREGGRRSCGLQDVGFRAWLKTTGDVEARAREELAVWMSASPDGYYPDTSPALIEQVAGELDIDWQRDWEPDDDFIGLWSKDELVALADRWGIGIGSHMKRAEIADTIANGMANSAWCMPEELVKLKPVRLV